MCWLFIGFVMLVKFVFVGSVYNLGWLILRCFYVLFYVCVIGE